jgi:hypothetical protein
MGGWGAVAPEALARAAPGQVAEGFRVALARAARDIFFDPFSRQSAEDRMDSFSTCIDSFFTVFLLALKLKLVLKLVLKIKISFTDSFCDILPYCFTLLPY